MSNLIGSTEPKCVLCKFWGPTAGGGGPGGVHFRQCRRNPPVIDEMASEADRTWRKGCWPVTPPGAWCGEFVLIENWESWRAPGLEAAGLSIIDTRELIK